MALIRIKHKHLTAGVLLDSSEFDPQVHHLFDAPDDATSHGEGEGGADGGEGVDVVDTTDLSVKPASKMKPKRRK